jgi:hypothetical protein
MRDVHVELSAEKLKDHGTSLFVFHLTPADIPANKGHVRKIVCACESVEDRDAWCDAIGILHVTDA